MHFRVPLHARYLALLGALGLVPLACDSVTETDFPCSNSEPDVVQSQLTGYETCTEGQRHRSEAVACASELPRSTTCEPPDPMFPGTCTSDADCTDQPHGYCGIFGQLPECSCSYGCVSDADCGDGQICDCGEPVGHCVSADCTTDDDCEGALLCVAYISDPGCGGTAFTCQSPDDLCSSDNDCPAGENCSKVGDKLECVMQACAIGRPFLVAGAHRTAEGTRRADWLEERRPDVKDMPWALRETLAAHWREVGLMEHASVAAFARFALQLLAQGAPHDLLLETQEAMRDETQHATLAFGMASAYGARDIGPGPLAIDGALDEDDPRAILRMVIHEGCIGETVAAIEAAEAAEHASDPVVRSLLQRIADDEQRHAELAWRYVSWAVESNPDLADTLLCELHAAKREQAPEEPIGAADRALLTHGVVTESVRSELRARVIASLIVPAAMQLVRQRAAA